MSFGWYLFIIFWIVSILYIEVCLGKLEKMKPKNKEEEKRDKDYFCFAQLDFPTGYPARILLYLFAPTILFKMLTLLTSLVFMRACGTIAYALFDEKTARGLFL